MINNELKAQFLNTDLPLYQRKISKLDFEINSILEQVNDKRFWLTEDEKKRLEFLRDEEEYWQEIMAAKYGYSFKENDLAWIECQKINKAYYRRVKRLKNKVAAMLQSPCLFLTLTFKDKYLDKTSDKTKRRYVQRTLNELQCEYVANVDYGEKKGRIHYHALVKIDHIDNKVWRYGNLDFKKIRRPNETAISKYICKLTNHAIKETTHASRLLYDKK